MLRCFGFGQFSSTVVKWSSTPQARRLALGGQALRKKMKTPSGKGRLKRTQLHLDVSLLLTWARFDKKLRINMWKWKSIAFEIDWNQHFKETFQHISTVLRQSASRRNSGGLMISCHELHIWHLILMAYGAQKQKTEADHFWSFLNMAWQLVKHPAPCLLQVAQMRTEALRQWKIRSLGLLVSVSLVLVQEPRGITGTMWCIWDHQGSCHGSQLNGLPCDFQSPALTVDRSFRMDLSGSGGPPHGVHWSWTSCVQMNWTSCVLQTWSHQQHPHHPHHQPRTCVSPPRVSQHWRRGTHSPGSQSADGCSTSFSCHPTSRLASWISPPGSCRHGPRTRRHRPWRLPRTNAPKSSPSSRPCRHQHRRRVAYQDSLAKRCLPKKDCKVRPPHFWGPKKLWGNDWCHRLWCHPLCTNFSTVSGCWPDTGNPSACCYSTRPSWLETRRGRSCPRPHSNRRVRGPCPVLRSLLPPRSKHGTRRIPLGPGSVGKVEMCWTSLTRLTTFVAYCFEHVVDVKLVWIKPLITNKARQLFKMQ